MEIKWINFFNKNKFHYITGNENIIYGWYNEKLFRITDKKIIKELKNHQACCIKETEGKIEIITKVELPAYSIAPCKYSNLDEYEFLYSYASEPFLTLYAVKNNDNGFYRLIIGDNLHRIYEDDKITIFRTNKQATVIEVSDKIESFLVELVKQGKRWIPKVEKLT